MQELQKLLDQILERVRFEVELSRPMARHLTSVETSYRAIETDLQFETVGPLTPEELRDRYQRSKYDRETSTTVKIIRTDCTEKQIQALIDQLRSYLDDYIESGKDRLGHGLDGLSGSGKGTIHPNYLISREKVSSLADFTEGLIVGAANLGSKHVLQLLRGWRKREPLRYQTKTLLSGVTVEQPLHLDGVHIEPLPKSSNELSASLPIGGYVPETPFLGGAILSVDSEAKPALFRPSSNDYPSSSTQTIQPSWVLGDRDDSLDAFCESLSLACNHCVRSNWVWNDYGDLTGFSFGPMRGVILKYVGDLGNKLPLQQRDLKCAWDIHCKRFSDKQREQRLGTAITRWVRSKQPESELGLLDSFIDLRIALEALYLDSGSGENRFRLATRGAWHLGATSSQRQEYYDTLYDTYNVASRIVHAGNFKTSQSNRDLLAAAQDVCREGILKRLREKRVPKWDEVVLDLESENDPG